ncbi:predicted protein [Naegleria gruberi]|uniref:Predicted protein n=1 Tax=Naegleria gruberi TaxID=5762 RepID=D2VKY3_NAEGR|nr:uncharacterized protein NAEGRDRAFT_69593 [Naegleria gruberi]EFC42523.1 predicted protein [Naegleria gruberi]|eukprot:XP_002675267.1 predicted protein [Naegleria gruberi strain NEG-M]
MDANWFAQQLGYPIQSSCNNPTQPCEFESLTQSLPRVFGPSGVLNNLTEKQLDTLLRVLRLCNIYEKHDSAPSELNEKQKKIYMIEQYYKNPDDHDVKALSRDFSEHRNAAGSPAHDMMHQSPDMYKTRNDYQASKIAHGAHDYVNTPEKLEKQISEALKLSPNCIEAYNLLAMYKAKNFEEALQYYRQGQSKKDNYYHPTNSKLDKTGNWLHHQFRQYFRAIIGEANVLRRMGRYEEALDAYYRAQKLDSEIHGMMVSYCNFQANIPECLMKLGRWKEAYDFMKKDVEMLKLSSSKYLLWSFGLCDYIVNKKTPQYNSVEDQIKYAERKNVDQDVAIVKSPLSAAGEWSSYVFEYLLGIRKLANVGFPRSFSSTVGEAPSFSADSQYVSDNLDLWLANPDALEYAIKNVNIVNSHLCLSGEEHKLKRKHFDHSKPVQNFFQVYSKLYFPNARTQVHLSLLHKAVDLNNLEAVKLLVEHGAPIRTPYEPNPFHFSCYYDRSREIVQFFCEKSGNPLFSSGGMPSPFEMAVNQGNWRPTVEILSYLLKRKKITNDILLTGIETIFSTSVYDCVKGGETCQRCDNHDQPHSKDLSFEKCIDALFLFGLKISKKEIQNLLYRTSSKDKLVKYILDRADGSVLILPRSLEVTDSEVLNLLSKIRNTSTSEKTSTTEPKTDAKSETKKSESSTESPEDLKNKGNEEFKKGACMKALDFYNKAIKHPECSSSLKPILYSNMSACFFNLKHFERALSCAEDSIKADTNFVKGYFRKAMSLEALKRIDEAIKVVKIALAKDPDNESMVTLFKKLKQQEVEKPVETDFDKLEKGLNDFSYFKDMVEKEGFTSILEKMKATIPKEQYEHSEKIGEMLDEMIKKCLIVIDKKFTPHRREIYSYLRNMSKDQRLKYFEGSTKFDHNNEKLSDMLRNVIIDVDTYSQMMDAVIYLGVENVKLSQLINPTSFLTQAHHIEKVSPLMFGFDDPEFGGWETLMHIITFLLTYSGDVSKKWEKATLSSMSKSKVEEVKEAATVYAAKKKKHCPMCPRIDDEKFSLLALSFDFNYQQHLNTISNIQNSIKDRQEAFNYISKCEEHVFELITEKNQLECLKKFLQASPDNGFEVLANIFAVAHLKPEHIEKSLKCVDILEKDSEFFKIILSFGSTAKSVLSPSLCRFIANGAFVSDKLGCLLEALLPALYHTLDSTFEIDRDILPDLNTLRAVASLSTIPNLKRGLHCLGFGQLIYQIQVHPKTSKLDPIKAGMAATSKDWMTSGEKQRIPFVSKFDASKKFTNEERRQFFAATPKFATNELAPIQPSLKEKIKQQGLTKGIAGKFIITASDGYGIFRIMRVDNMGGEYVVTCLLFNAYTQVLRDQLATSFPSTKQCDNFLKSYLGSTRQFRPYKTKFADEPFACFTVISDNVALDIAESAINETIKIRPLNSEEEEVVQAWRMMFGRPKVGKQKNTRTLYEVLWTNLSDLKQPPRTPYTFRFYREMFCTPFFHNFYFAIAEKVDFGFMMAFETISGLNIQSIHDMVPLPTESVMDWIICMCDVVDHAPEAKKFLVNIFTFAAHYFKVYGNTDIASDMYQSLKKWKDGSIKAINVPFIRAFIERSLYYDGQEMLPDAMLVKIYQTYGFEHAINTALENSRSRVPARFVPRNSVFTEISKGVAKWCMARKEKGKKAPNLKTLFEKLVPLIAKHPEMGELSATLLISMSHQKLTSLLSSVWSDISAEKMDISIPQDIFEIDSLRMSFVKEERARLEKKPTRPRVETYEESSLPSAIASVGVNEVRTEKSKKKSEMSEAKPSCNVSSTHPPTSLPTSQTSSSNSPIILENVSSPPIIEQEKRKEVVVASPVTTSVSSPPTEEKTTIDESASKSYNCACCGKPNSKKKCGACQAVVYCSKECQASHWKVHKTQCKKL